MASIVDFEWEAHIEDSVGQSLDRTITERALIVTDEPIEDTSLIWRDRRVPDFGDRRAVNRGLELKAVYVRERDLDTDDGQIWTLTVKSSSVSQREKPPNPLNEPADIEVAGVAASRLTARDVDGKFYRNSAGEILAPHEIRDGAAKIMIAKNVRAEPLPSWLLDYTSPPVLNADGLVIKGRFWPRGTLIFSPGDLRIGTEEFTEPNIRWVRVGIALDYRRGGWEDLLLDEGLNELWYEGQLESQDISSQDRHLPTTFINRGDKPFLRPILVGEVGKEEPTQTPLFLNRFGQAYRDDKGRIRSKLEPHEILTIKTKDYRVLPFKTVLPLR